MKTTEYNRKISSREAQEGFIFILKSKLNFFPQLREEFKLRNDDRIDEVTVESYPCTCRGPNLPHEHYFIKWEGLKAGDKIKIVKELERKYRLQKGM